jgi:hypothetical protein
VINTAPVTLPRTGVQLTSAKVYDTQAQQEISIAVSPAGVVVNELSARNAEAQAIYNFKGNFQVSDATFLDMQSQRAVVVAFRMRLPAVFASFSPIAVEANPAAYLAARRSVVSNAVAAVAGVLNSISRDWVLSDSLMPMITGTATVGNLLLQYHNPNIYSIGLTPSVAWVDYNWFTEPGYSVVQNDPPLPPILGTGALVADYEPDRPAAVAGLNILDTYNPHGNNGWHPQAVDGIISGTPHSVAPGAELLVANTDNFDSLSWAFHGPHFATNLNVSTAQSVGCGLFCEAFGAPGGLNDRDTTFDQDSRIYPFPFVAVSAGNDGNDADPNHQHVENEPLNGLVVGATDENTSYQPAYFTSWKNPLSPHGDREEPSVCAPGNNIDSNGVTNAAGTSFAAPQVAGLGALLDSMGIASVPAVSPLYPYQSYPFQVGRTLPPELKRALILAGAVKNPEGLTWFSNNGRKIDRKCGVGGVDALLTTFLAAQSNKRKQIPFGTPVSFENPNFDGWDYEEPTLPPQNQIGGGSFDAKGWYNGFNNVWQVAGNFGCGSSYQARTRVILAFDSSANNQDFLGIPNGNDDLQADLDLFVYDNNNVLIFESNSFDNGYEIVDYPSQPGTTNIRVGLSSSAFDSNQIAPFAIAWQSYCLNGYAP